ncbi:MAG: OsmC family protein [Candidatus Marinimicrobia bacterium]|nr:OsmC family protein [Candidatus Neomarinimicrobiota bacterium]
MSKSSIDIAWNKKMSFKTSLNGHEIILDADKNVGGEDKGPPPKPFMLIALGGCTAMDVISILGKMRVEVEDFHVRVEGELTEEHPKHYHKMHVIYEFKGENLPMDKIKKAVKLSEDRYCGVSATYKKAMELTSEIKIIN